MTARGGGRKGSRTPAIMLQGLTSNAGKSVLATALCRILLQDGYRVAPFKAQNMSLNSYVTQDGREMGRAQVLQAQACRLEPDVLMNPILLKPSSDTGSQVIVMGRPVGNMGVRTYHRYKEQAVIEAHRAYDRLAASYDVLVLEGAGSPAEVNLKRHDLTNMAMARYAGARVLLAGDIDRGGVFASFVGTMAVLEQWERDLVAGYVINRFRGDASLLDSAIEYVSRKTGKPFFGIVPNIAELGLPEEDSVTFKAGWGRGEGGKADAPIHVACLDLPHISNFTDLDPLLIEPDVQVRIIKSLQDIEAVPDVLIIPGSKNTLTDLQHLQDRGFAEGILRLAERGVEVIGICGGFQMLGEKVADPFGIESEREALPGLNLLPVITELGKEKHLSQVSARHIPSGCELKGYEIHHGETRRTEEGLHCLIRSETGQEIGFASSRSRVWGTYLHGLFDADAFRRCFLDSIRVRKGLKPLEAVQASFDLEEKLDRLAEVVREGLDMDLVYAELEARS
jgi:cobyric acid synthase CobQ